jgi:hypothetical protein
MPCKSRALASEMCFKSNALQVLKQLLGIFTIEQCKIAAQDNMWC